MTNLEVAKIILEQLGGKVFSTFTGAKNFTAGDSEGGGSLAFKLPANTATKGINYVKVSLTAADDYTMEFGKVWGTKYTVIATSEMIYCDMLQDEFLAKTGLYTKFGQK